MLSSTWQPLRGPVKDWPLGLLDYRSVDATEDLVARDVVYPTYDSESYQVYHNARHRWYYLSNQMPDEMLVFKSFDSDKSVATCK